MSRAPSTVRIALVLSAGPFVTSMDQTLVNAVFPAILDEYDGALATASWVANGAALALATGLVAGGRLADTLGPRRAFVVGQIAFASCSLAAVFAPGLQALVVARIGLGFSAALVLASSLALISSAVAGPRRATAVGLYAAMGGLGSVAGPLLGAAAGHALSWRSGFAPIAGIAATAAVLSARWLPASEAPRFTRVRWAPALGASLAIGPLVFALSSGPQMGWSSPAVASAFTGALVLAAVVAWAEWHRPHGLIPDTLPGRGFGAVLVGAFGLGLALGIGLFGLPLFVTQVLGTSFQKGSLVLAPGALVSILTAMLCPALLRALGHRRVSGIGLGLACLGVLAYGSLGPDATFGDVMLLSAISGLGLGLGIPALAAATLELCGEEEAGLASGWFHASRMLGVALGVVAFSQLSSRPSAPGAALGAYGKAFLECGMLVLVVLAAWTAISARPRGARRTVDRRSAASPNAREEAAPNPSKFR